jgi:hypothetical protein
VIVAATVNRSAKRRTLQFRVLLLRGSALMLAAPCFLGVGLSVLLVVVAGTWRGRAFGIAALFGLIGLLFLLKRTGVRKTRCCWKRAGTLLLTSAALVVVCYLLAPKGQSEQPSSIQSVYTGESRYRRLSPASLVPEIDQIRLGSHVLPFVDPHVDREKARRFRSLFERVYADIASDADLRDAGSVLHDCYADILLGTRDHGHYYVCWPSSMPAEERLPVLVFFHGWLGNMKAYAWVWKCFADRYGVAVVCPTFGAGYWYRDGGEEAIAGVMAWCRDHPRLDASRLYVAGLSNGGVAATRAVLLSDDAPRGTVYISPVLEGEIVCGKEFVDRMGSRPVMVVSGAQDARIDGASIQGQVARMQAAGLNVTSRLYENEDHLLILSAFERLAGDVARCLELDESESNNQREQNP